MEKAVHLPPNSEVLGSVSTEAKSSECVCVCRGAQLFFYLGAGKREREVSRLLTWSLCAGANKHLSTVSYAEQDG